MKCNFDILCLHTFTRIRNPIVLLEEDHTVILLCAKYKTSSKYDCSQCGCGILSSLYFLKNSFLFHSFGSYLRDDANKVLDTNIFFHCTCRPYHIFCAYNDSKDIVVYFDL